MSRILHFADLHLDASTRANTEHALEQLIEASREQQPDLIVNAGDLSMRRGLVAPWVSHALRRLHVELAKVAPVIVVSGNHDMSGNGEVGAVLGALDLSDAMPGRLHLIERPQVVRVAGLAVACLPYPSRQWLLAQRPELSAKEVLPALSDELAAVARGLGAEIAPGERAILVYHGSISGARTDSEQTMSTEIDLVLNEGEIPAVFEAVLCGHIHKAQGIGRAVYSGSPCPLNFGEGKSEHGYVMWDTGQGEAPHWQIKDWTFTHHVLRPKHRMVTVDMRGTLEDQMSAINDGGDGRYVGARIRVLGTVASGVPPEAATANWTAFYMNAGAHEVKVIIERPEENRVTGPEVSAEASMGALLYLYAARHPGIDADTLAGLKDLAVEVDGALTPEARLAQKVGGYRLHRLGWSNWKSYGEGNEIDLDTLGRLVVIEGENATGKSNAAEVEAFALYGKFVRGRQSLAEAVRIGQDEAIVSAEFEADGSLWKVQRRIKVNGKGVGSQVLTLSRCVARGVFEAADAGTASETQKKIESLVGPFDLYLATRFASQGDIDRLLELSPAEMKDTLQKALATSVFDEREKIGTALRNVAERTLAEHEASLTAWREIAGGKDVAAAALELSKSTHAEAVRACEQTTERQRAAEAALVLATAEASELDARRADHNAAKAAREDALVAMADAENNVARLESLVASLGDIESKLAALRELRQQKTDEEVLLAQAREAEAQAVTAEREVERLTLQLTALEEKAAAALARHEDDTEDRIRRLGEKIDAARKAAALIGSVPFGEKCAEAKCAFVRNAVEARDGLAALDAEQANVKPLYEARREELIAEYQAKAKPLREAFTAAKARAGELRATAEVAAHGGDYLAECVQAIAFLEAGGWEEKSRQAAEANGRLDALRPALEEKRSEAKRASDRLEALGPRPDAAGTSERLEEARRVAGEAKACSAAAADLLEKAVRAGGVAEGRLAECQKAEAKLAESESVGAAHRRRVELCRIYVRAVGRDGLPFLMLERALPALEAHANHFLSEDDPSGLRLEIGGLKDLQSGESRSEVTLRYRNGFGTHSVAAASGFERSVIGIALRAALSQVQAEASGMGVEHWITDECSGVCDETNLLVMQQVFRRIAERFGRVIFISHQKEVQQIADSRLRVFVTSDGSRIAA